MTRMTVCFLTSALLLLRPLSAPAEIKDSRCDKTSTDPKVVAKCLFQALVTGDPQDFEPFSWQPADTDESWAALASSPRWVGPKPVITEAMRAKEVKERSCKFQFQYAAEQVKEQIKGARYLGLVNKVTTRVEDRVPGWLVGDISFGVEVKGKVMYFVLDKAMLLSRGWVCVNGFGMTEKKPREKK